jgi:hypothetical protein
MIVGALNRSTRRGLDFENFVFDGLVDLRYRNISNIRLNSNIKITNIDDFGEFSGYVVR